MPPNVQFTEATFARLQRLAVPLVDTPETVVVKLVDYWEEEHFDAGSEALPTTNRLATSSQLSQKEFRRPFLEALAELGGKANSAEVTKLVGMKLAARLGPGDHKLRTDGKERWENVVHWTRFKLVKEGLLKEHSSRDVWELSDDGRTHVDALLSIEATSEAQTTSAPREFDSASVPDLTHTKLLSANVAGHVIQPTWNGLLLHMIRSIPKERLAGIDQARRLVIVNFVNGRKEDEGYRFVPELNLSIQGQDANAAWKGISHIARNLGLTVEVDFLWRMKEGSEFPGVTGRLTV